MMGLHVCDHRVERRRHSPPGVAIDDLSYRLLWRCDEQLVVTGRLAESRTALDGSDRGARSSSRSASRTAARRLLADVGAGGRRRWLVEATDSEPNRTAAPTHPAAAINATTLGVWLRPIMRRSLSAATDRAQPVQRRTGWYGHRAWRTHAPRPPAHTSIAGPRLTSRTGRREGCARSRPPRSRCSR